MASLKKYKPAFLTLAVFANGYLSFRGIYKYAESGENEDLFSGFVFGVWALVMIVDLYFFLI